MKKFWLVVAALAALAASPAMAADLGPAVFQQPPPPIIVPTMTWTGCYLGGSGGAGFSTWTFSNPTDNPTVPGDRGYLQTTDVVAGAQVGCDYQSGEFVFGFQGMGDWSPSLKGRFFDATTASFDISAQARWFATATGRIGVAATPQTLVYAKGGAAWVNNQYQNNGVAALCNFSFTGCNDLVANTTTTQIGWTVGFGAEYMFAPNWSVFVEYNYMNFGNPSVGFNVTCPASVAPPCVPTNAFQVSQHIQTILLGVNFRFSLAPAPVVARY